MLPFNSIHSLNGFLFSLLTPSLSQRRGLPLRNLVRHLSEHLSTVQVARNASLPGPKLARRLLPLDLAAVVVVPVVPSSPQLGLLGRNEEYACTCRDSTLNIILLPCELLCCFLLFYIFTRHPCANEWLILYIFSSVFYWSGRIDAACRTYPYRLLPASTDHCIMRFLWYFCIIAGTIFVH